MFALLFTLTCTAPSAELRASLRGIDNRLDQHVLEALCVDPVGELAIIAADASEPTHVRARATAILSRFIGTRTRTSLITLSSDANPTVRLKALKGLRNLAETLPELADDALNAAVSARLADSDRFVRMQAVRAAPLSVLRAYLQRESDPAIYALAAERLNH